MILALPLLLACAKEITEVGVSGRVTDDLRGGSPVPGAAVTVRGEDGAVWSEAEADGEGRFEATLPASQVFSLAAEAEGFVPTAFTGYAGTQPLAVEDGEVWVRSAADAAALREAFAGCAAEGGAMIEGEVRIYVVPDADLQTLPLVTTASVVAIDADGGSWPACYLDDAGATSPDAEKTGETGRFGIFGLAEGMYTLELTYDDEGGNSWTDEAYLYVPAGGAAPQYPALVGLPR